MGLTAIQQSHVYLIATSEENQQAVHKSKFCAKADNGASIAECTNDKMATSWFGGQTDPRYVIWFFRNVTKQCQWDYHDRYSTNSFKDPNYHKTIMLKLLGDSIACAPTPTPTTPPTGKTTTSTTLPQTTPPTTTTTLLPVSTQMPPADGRCPIVIDTRTQLEWDEGHAACAHRLEIQDNPSLVAEVSKLANGDLSYPVQLYCRSGNRAGTAQKIMQDKKWTSVTNAGGWTSGEVEAIKKLCECTTTTANPTTTAAPSNVPATTAPVSSTGEFRGVLAWIVAFACVCLL